MPCSRFLLWKQQQTKQNQKTFLYQFIFHIKHKSLYLPSVCYRANTGQLALHTKQWEKWEGNCNLTWQKGKAKPKWVINSILRGASMSITNYIAIDACCFMQNPKCQHHNDNTEKVWGTPKSLSYILWITWLHPLGNRLSWYYIWRVFK